MSLRKFPTTDDCPRCQAPMMATVTSLDEHGQLERMPDDPTLFRAECTQCDVVMGVPANHIRQLKLTKEDLR